VVGHRLNQVGIGILYGVQCTSDFFSVSRRVRRYGRQLWVPSRDLASVTLSSSLQYALDFGLMEHVVIELTHRTGSGSSVYLSRRYARRGGTVGPASTTPSV
jgi:hypothetical protein